MKALTLKHPWPWAICVLGKRIENRTWRPGRQLPVGEWFAIHGGKWPVSRSDEENVYEEVYDLAIDHGPDLDFEDIYADARRHSGMVAVCRFGGVVTESTDPWFEGPVGWRLDGLVVLPEPVPCKGAQGLWEIPEDVLSRVREQWVAAKAKGVAS
jgi:hypothetical protein